MRKLLVFLILLTALWSGYWFAGSTALRNAVDDWFTQAGTRGLVAEKTGLAVRGFPNRFDLTVEGLSLADPARGVGWQAPFAQVFAMTWKPWHVIAAFPPDQVVTLPDQDVAIQSQDLRASVRVKPATDAPLAAAIVEASTLTLTSTAGWTTGAGRTVASISADEEVPGATDAPNAYVVALDLAGLSPDPALLARLVPDGSLPAGIATVRLRSTVTLTAPLDRYAGQTRPRLAALTLSDMLVTWGEVSITATGDIAPDDQGLAAGRIDFAITNWQRIVPVLVAAGVVQPNLERTVETMLANLATQTGDPNVLKLPLVLEDGWVSLGPVPLGPAPLMVPPSG